MTSVDFEFNTALTGVDSENGKFDEKAFDELAKKIRGHIMAQPSGDGISGMRIARYGVHVDYETTATTRANVVAAVEEGIAWAATSLEGAFPLREGKTPEAVLKVYIPKPTGRTSVTARLKTNLYRRPADKKQSASVRKQLTEAFVDLDGVTDFRSAMDGVSLDITDAVTTPELAKAHIHKVLQGFAMTRTAGSCRSSSRLPSSSTGRSSSTRCDPLPPITKYRFSEYGKRWLYSLLPACHIRYINVYLC
ncbi:MAG: hypothetical protein WAQ27_04635 [Candidatus Microsaccharimonas sp.]